MIARSTIRQPFNRTRVSVATAAALMGMALAGCNGSFADNNPVEAAASSPPPAVATASPRNVAAALPDFASLVEHYGAAVVNVAVVGKTQPVADIPGMQPNDPLYEFFRRFGQPGPRPARRSAAGAWRGLRLHRERRWLHPDQRARGGERR